MFHLIKKFFNIIQKDYQKVFQFSPDGYFYRNFRNLPAIKSHFKPKKEEFFSFILSFSKRQLCQRWPLFNDILCFFFEKKILFFMRNQTSVRPDNKIRYRIYKWKSGFILILSNMQYRREIYIYVYKYKYSAEKTQSRTKKANNFMNNTFLRQNFLFIQIHILRIPNPFDITHPQMLMCICVRKKSIQIKSAQRTILSKCVWRMYISSNPAKSYMHAHDFLFLTKIPMSRRNCEVGGEIFERNWLLDNFSLL